MGWAKLALALVALQCIFALLLDSAAAADPPLPVFNGMCNGSVDCGKGTCEPSVKTAFGFECVCDPGWSQSELRVEDYWRFLPCVIPNCTTNYSCSNGSVFAAAAPLSAPPLTNISLLDPCLYSFCGGGSCVKESTFEHRCECKEGFSNLLNLTTFPCYNDCSLGTDCSNLGISMSNTSGRSSPSPSDLSDQGNASAAGGAFAPNTWLLVAFSAIVPLAMLRTR